MKFPGIFSRDVKTFTGRDITPNSSDIPLGMVFGVKAIVEQLKNIKPQFEKELNKITGLDVKTTTSSDILIKLKENYKTHNVNHLENISNIFESVNERPL